MMMISIHQDQMYKIQVWNLGSSEKNDIYIINVIIIINFNFNFLK